MLTNWGQIAGWGLEDSSRYLGFETFSKGLRKIRVLLSCNNLAEKGSHYPCTQYSGSCYELLTVISFGGRVASRINFKTEMAVASQSVQAKYRFITEYGTYMYPAQIESRGKWYSYYFVSDLPKCLKQISFKGERQNLGLHWVHRSGVVPCTVNDKQEVQKSHQWSIGRRPSCVYHCDVSCDILLSHRPSVHNISYNVRVAWSTLVHPI